jgi:hypothetical protein
MVGGSRYLGMALLVAFLGGCGRSGSAAHRTTGHRAASHPVSVCTPVARGAVARSFAIPIGAVAFVESVGNNAEPQCAYTAHLAAGKRVTLIANVDSSPQPYFRLERTYIEAAQVFTPGRLIPPPQAITGLGLEADWFPTQSQLMTTDGYRLITLSYAWRGASQRQEQIVGERLARTYLHTPHGKVAQAIAAGYPG